MGGLLEFEGEASDQNFEVNLLTKRCIKRAPMLEPRFAFGTVNYGEWIIVAGGMRQLS